MFGLSKPAARRWLLRLGVIGLLAAFVVLGLRAWVRNSVQQRFLADVVNRHGFYELRPVGPQPLRDALGADRMQGFDEIIGVGLADADIDDAWLELNLQRLQTLEWIDLTGTAVTAVGLERVLRLPRLKELYLLDSTVPDEQLAAIFAQHPQVTVQPLRKARKASLMALRPIHTQALTFAQFSPDGLRVVTGNGAGRVRVWGRVIGISGIISQPRSNGFVQNSALNLAAHDGWVFQAAWSPDGTMLATIGTDDWLRMWNVEDGALRGEWRDDEGDLHGVVFSPDGERIFVAGDGGTVRALRSDDFTELFAATGHTRPIPGLALSPDGHTLASVSRDRTLRLWNAETGAELAVQSDHEADVYAVAFSPDGSHLATAGYDRLIHLRESERGESVQVLRSHDDWVFAVAFSADGRTLASGSGDGTIRLWNVATGDCEQTLRRQRAVSGLSFRGNLLASSGIDGAVCLWNWKTGELEGVLRPAPRGSGADFPLDSELSPVESLPLADAE